jgi:DNA polymerase alpha subunit A
VETSLELKGLDMVRRDWAPIAATTARSVLNEIMTDQTIDDKIYKIVKILADTAEELREGRVLVKDLLITKQLAKNPEEYKARQGLYHVEVALKMNNSGKFSKKFKNGDTVPYLFCKDKLPHHPSELMESRVKAKPEEVKNDNETDTDTKNAVLEYDPEYYLSSQVHPVVSRICEPIPGLDAARIAEALGMDPTSYKKRRVVENNQEDLGLGEMSETEKYKNCEKFKFKCVGCRQEITLESPVVILEV